MPVLIRVYFSEDLAYLTAPKHYNMPCRRYRRVSKEDSDRLIDIYEEGEDFTLLTQLRQHNDLGKLGVKCERERKQGRIML